MVNYGRRLLLTVIALITLLGPLIVSAQAAMLPMRVEIFQHEFDTDSNGNTYISFGPMDNFAWNARYIEHDEDLNWESFIYYGDDWDTPDGSLMGPAYRRTELGNPGGESWGWLDTGSILNGFLIFENTTNEYYLRMDEKRTVFPLAIGQEGSLLMESGNPYYGTFNVTDEEFLHLTIASQNDQAYMFIGVFDPNGRLVAEWYLDDGNIDVCPFKPTGEGTYTLYIQPWNEDEDASLVKFLIEGVTPQSLAFGEMAEGVLEGSEIYLGEDSSVVHREKAPHAITYKVSTNSTTPGIIRAFFNYPEIMPLSQDMYEPWIYITGDAHYYEVLDVSFMDGMGGSSSSYYYKSFANETYYFTVLGMDEVSYALMNNMAYAPAIPRNEIFYIENPTAHDKKFLYKLDLGQDSVLKVNSTESSGGFDWHLWTVDGTMTMWETGITTSSSFFSAPTYYIPAGSYLLEADADGSGSAGWYEFNFGPVLEGAGAISVDIGDIVGVRVETDPMTFYRLNTTLTTHANITAYTDVDILNHLGGYIITSSNILGNRQDGVYWHEFISNRTSWELGTSSTAYSMFTDDFAIITYAPYDAENNTIGLVDDWYGEYTLDYNVAFYEDADSYVNGTSQVTVASSPVWNNVTLGDPGENNERYVMEITCPDDTWFNFSIYVEDVDSFTAYVYQDVAGQPQRLDWLDLADTFIGSTDSEASFQFGSISPNMLLVFEVDRTLSDEGRLDVLITPFLTNQYVYSPPVEYFEGGTTVPAGAPIAMDAIVVVGGFAVIAIVVVVVVVYARKTGRI